MTGGLAAIITYLPEITNWISSLVKGKEAINQAKLSLGTLNGALESSDYSNAISQMNELKINVGLAKKGFLDKKEVLQQYNDTVGKTMGKATDLNKVEAILVKNGPSYIQMTLLKATAQLALQDAAKKAYEAEQAKLKSDDEVLTFWDKAKGYLKTGAAAVAGGGAAGASEYAKVQAENIQTAKQRRKEAIDDANNQKDSFLAIAQRFQEMAAKIAKKSGFDLFSGQIVPTGLTGKREPKPPVLAESQQKGEIIDHGTTPVADSDHNLTQQPAGGFKTDLLEQYEKKKAEIKKTALQQAEELAKKSEDKIAAYALSTLINGIKKKADAKIAALEKDKTAELSNSSLTSAQKLAIENKYKKREAAVKVKAFKDEQKASIAQAIINGAIAITKAEAQTGVLGPLVIPGIIAETAVQVAKVASQKPPAYAKGGLHYSSDGRGGVLPGYSRTDNTNAYLRSGEGIIVSEAMQVPWARNLVSAINVGFGGRDFSMTNPGRGYAVGGIFTDGGDANRYYNQPATDQKNLANTIAYQMINNFPPVYVDVKDVNNQQNILAQTINRVNL